MLKLRAVSAAGALLIATSAGSPAFAQKPGGILSLSHFDSPASMSILEEATGAALRPMMGVFNNLVIAQSSLETIRRRQDRAADRALALAEAVRGMGNPARGVP